MKRRPTGTVSTSLDLDTFEEGRRQPLDPDPVDHDDLAEVHLETTGLASPGQRQDLAPFPLPFRSCRFEQQVRNFFTTCREQAKIAKVFLGAGQQLDIDLEPVATRSAGFHNPLDRSLRLAGKTASRHKQTDQRTERTTDHDRFLHSFPSSDGRSTNFCNATATTARVRARRAKDATR